MITRALGRPFWPILALALLVAACGGDDAGVATSTTARPVATTTTAGATTTAGSGGEFEAAVSTVTAEELGASWHEGCPVPVEDLRAIDLTHWGMDGAAHRGRLVVAAAEADHVVAVFRALFRDHYPIERMEPIVAFGGDDDASMAVNNTSAFNCRTVKGSTRISEHAYGRAMDVNPLLNPYVFTDGTVDPPLGAPYADRTRTDPGLIHDADPIVAAFAEQGWEWGGHWSGARDYQHFSASGR